MSLFCFCLFFSLLASGQSPTKFFQSFDGTTIAYNDQGRGFPVILVHGFINTKDSWEGTEIQKDLIEGGFRVVAIDLRGNGESEQPIHAGAYAGNAEVKDLIALVDHLRLKKYYAIGYSRGSIVLASLLSEDKRIKKAILGGMGLDCTNPNWERRIMFMEGFRGKTDDYPETKGAVDYATSIGANLHILSLLQQEQPVPSINLLEKVSIPVLVIAGDTDEDNGKPSELAAVFKKGKLVLVQGDHNTTYRKRPFAREVMKFIR